jgi:hypothetical protein
MVVRSVQEISDRSTNSVIAGDAISLDDSTFVLTIITYNFFLLAFLAYHSHASCTYHDCNDYNIPKQILWLDSLTAFLILNRHPLRVDEYRESTHKNRF